MATPRKRAAVEAELTPPKLSCPAQPQQSFREVEAVLKAVPDGVRPQALKELRLLLQEFCQKWQLVEDSDLEPEEAASEDEDGAASADDLEPRKRARKAPTRPPPDDGYPQHLWKRAPSLSPGREGFVGFAQSFLENASSWQPPSLGKIKLLPQQRNVVALLHPKSPVQRLLVDHNTGSGKTLLMLRVLDNYYFDERPKIAIFPKDSVCDNFYQAVLAWPTRWRDFFAGQCPAEASVAANCSDWRKRRHEVWDLTLQNSAMEKAVKDAGVGMTLQRVLKNNFLSKVRSVLEMKRAFRNGILRSRYLESLSQDDTVPVPAAPLRAYRFTSAGGRPAAVEDGVPLGCIFKIGFDPKDGNVYSRKIVVMDEGHHLTRPHPLYQEQLSNLRQLVSTAKDTVVALCTGTFAEDSVKDPSDLLCAVKGLQNMSLNDEGFLSSHHVRGAAFPREIPPGVSDGALAAGTEQQLVHRVELRGEALMRYMFQEIRLRREGNSQEQLDARLANYTNLHVFASSFGNETCKWAVLQQTKEHAPKLREIVEMAASAIASRKKAVVMIARRNGYLALLELLRARGRRQGFRVAELSELADFNSKSNAHGEHYGVMVANSEQAAEGIEFKCVRLHILVDVPTSHAAYVQRASRSVRCYGHSFLEKEERDVRFALFVARLPEYARTEVGAFLLWAMCGYWSPTNRKSYGRGEPSADEVEQAVKDILQEACKLGVSSIRQLPTDIEAIVPDSGISTKLWTRLDQGLHALARGFPGLRLPADHTLTADERALNRLRSQARTLAPAVQHIRGLAVDAGLY